MEGEDQEEEAMKSPRPPLPSSKAGKGGLRHDAWWVEAEFEPDLPAGACTAWVCRRREQRDGWKKSLVVMEEEELTESSNRLLPSEVSGSEK